MKFSALPFDVKEELYYSSDFDDFRDDKADKKMITDFERFAHSFANTTGYHFELDDNLEPVCKDSDANTALENEMLKIVKNKWDNIVAEANEEFAYYSEEYDKDINEFYKDYDFTHDGEFISKEEIIQSHSNLFMQQVFKFN